MDRNSGKLDITTGAPSASSESRRALVERASVTGGGQARDVVRTNHQDRDIRSGSRVRDLPGEDIERARTRTGVHNHVDGAPRRVRHPLRQLDRQGVLHVIHADPSEGRVPECRDLQWRFLCRFLTARRSTAWRDRDVHGWQRGRG